ncbi:MAG: hypothetical protein M3004_04465 [Bacteroidota bacterium]|nr:hypothetical protein [Bacteroidota bacterium]
MEVHKHPHHVMHKKKWTEYLLEFFMLFLAVFLGFLAENQRERIVEHEREKQYMQSLLSDLAADTARFNRGIPLKEQRIKAIDTVFMFFNSHPDAKNISGKLFRTIRRTQYDQIFTRNTITINQLKNAGGMRLVRNKQIADSISSYDFNCANYDLYNEYYKINSPLANRYIEKLTNVTDLLPFFIANTGGGIRDNIPDSIVIRVNTGELNEQLSFMMLQKSYARLEINQFQDIRNRAIHLMELIKKEYHLE